jgi:hypothetical protein
LIAGYGFLAQGEEIKASQQFIGWFFSVNADNMANLFSLLNMDWVYQNLVSKGLSGCLQAINYISKYYLVKELIDGYMQSPFDGFVRLELPPPTPSVLFFEGWESVALGNPVCGVMAGGISNCYFSGDSGPWLVSELQGETEYIGSVEVLPGKKIKLQCPLSRTESHLITRNLYVPLNPDITISFNGHSAEIPADNSFAGITMIISLEAPQPTPCPGTEYSVGDTYIAYIFENKGSFLDDMYQSACTARVNVGPVPSFSTNLYNDFASLIPFSPEGWRITQMNFVVHRGSGSSPWATWDNIKITGQ